MTPLSLASLGSGSGRVLCLCLVLAGLAAGSSRAASAEAASGGERPASFELRDGDRVVLLGDTLIEREQAHGFVELTLAARFPDRNVLFRNLGWSADTPQGESRVGFDHDKPPEFWFHQLTNSIAQVRPTVVVLGYGMANSFAGDAGLPSFIGGMSKLMNAIRQHAGATHVRFVILTPIPHDRLAPPFPDPAAHNHQLAAYTQALRVLAGWQESPFVSLFDVLTTAKTTSPLTD